MISSLHFKRGVLTLILGSLIFTDCFEAEAAAPKVIATQPRNGDEDVPVALQEINVSFDQEMDRSGYSFTRGELTFPKIAGKPFWRSARECVLPVQLEPGRAYSVGINSATNGNFKGLNGESAEPFLITFKTRASGSSGQASMVEPGVQAASLRALRDAIERGYSYREVHPLDWPATWKQFEPRLLAAKTAREFAIIAGEMLAGTQDAHIWLTEAGEIIPAFRRVAKPNANLQLLPSLVSGWTQRHPMVAVGRAAPGIGYMAIHSWDRKHAPQLLEAAFAALDDLRDCPALIVDLRFNSGGDERLAGEFAGCFIRERKLYARHRTVDAGSSTGLSAVRERWLEPTRNRPAVTQRLAVLMGRVNMSSAEAFLLMMKQVPDCQLVGERSYGASGAPQPYLLANGVTVHLPSWQAMLPDGSSLETKGVAPDVAVEATDDAFRIQDPVLAKAIELLKK